MQSNWNQRRYLVEMVGFLRRNFTCSLVSMMLCVLCLLLGPLSTVAASTPLPFGSPVSDKQFLSRASSPYVVDSDLLVTETGSLTIDAGVVLKFRPAVGITVRGALVAKGDADARIVFDTAEEAVAIDSPQVRLVDGPSPLSGRLQIFHMGHWRSICTNSRNWTIADYEATCRQMGFLGGRYVDWMDRVNSSSSRPLLLENPRCPATPDARLLTECQWHTRRVGPGVCDFHPDLAMECADRFLPESPLVGTRWRGLRFENGRFKKELTQANTLYVKMSESHLHYVDILNAGVGLHGKVHSALETIGVVPQMDNVRVQGSAFNGMNLTQPTSVVSIRRATVMDNRGYGIYVNTSSGSVLVDSCLVSNNSNEGIKYLFHDLIPDMAGDSIVETHDLCTSASTQTPVYPLPILAESYRETFSAARCEKRFTAAYGQVLTLHFIHMSADEDGAAEITIRDGPDERSPLIGRVVVRNDTRPQSITTTRNSIWLVYTAKASQRTVMHMELTSGFSKAVDLNVTDSNVTNNAARGIAVVNLRSLMHIQGSTVRENVLGGVQITDGAGDVNVTESYVGFNYGDGINMTYSGGRVNISRTSIEANIGHGIVTWFNQTSLKLVLNQEFIVAYSNFSLNKWTAVLVGNFCSSGSVNITSNLFNDSTWDAVEIVSCWQADAPLRNVYVGHNKFLHNNRLGLVISPIVSMSSLIEHNLFRYHQLGCLLLRNPDALELESLAADVTVSNNRFEFNAGSFVVNLGLSQYGESQRMFFTRNWIKRNTIRQPFPMLHPRSRVAAVVVIASSNVNVTRNMIDNQDSAYEIGSQLEDHSRQIYCVRNWLGARVEKEIFYRIFDRKDRYNLAQVTFKPFLLHDTNFDSDAESNIQDFVPSFVTPGSRLIGGEVTGQEELIEPGDYHVIRDIVIHPTGRLTVAFGVTLRFEHTLGMMVGGELVAEGSASSADAGVMFSLKERFRELDLTDGNVTLAESERDFGQVVRLVGGRSPNEGRLQVKIKERWGTVCNYGWTIQSAAIACQQMGLVLNPQDWYLESNQLSHMGLDDPVLVSNVRCTDFDTDIRQCRSEPASQLENDCGHDQDVGLRCHDVSWAGIRFGMTAKKSVMRHATVEKAGLFDYSTYSFQPAVRVDFHHHVLDRLRLVDNDFDGMGVMYSDIYYPERIPSIKNSEFSSNRGHGISLRSLGIQLADCRVEDNVYSGVHYNPMITRQEMREMVGWLSILKAENFITIPDARTVELVPDQPRYLRSTRVPRGQNVETTLVVQTDQRNVIGMQVIQPIQNSSTEEIHILDYGDLSNEVWNVRINLTSFPTVSSSYRITVQFKSGSDAKGGAVILLSAFRRTDLQVQRSRLLSGPIPTLTLTSTSIRRNGKGLSVLHYNRFLSLDGNQHYLRKANESIRLIGCDLSQNKEEAISVHAPFRDVGRQPLAEIRYMINYTSFDDNERAIVQSSRDLRDSNNLFHWILQNNTMKNNRNGGLDLRLPYVWQYNENYTHTVFMSQCDFHGNRNFGVVVDGHFARVNITDNTFESNDCKPGLLSVRGMEKQLYILRNLLRRNTGNFMVEFNIDSQSEIVGEVPAYFSRNSIRDNAHHARSFQNNPHLVASYSLAMKGVQKVNVTDNSFVNNAVDYELLAGIRTTRLDNFVNVYRNYWGTPNVEQINEKIFDFDDWNSYAIARFRPYFLEDLDLVRDGAQSTLSERFEPMDVDHLGGRLFHDLVLPPRPRPYVVHTDLTVMPGVTLTILPGVDMEFYPSVGILVLGFLHAEGHWEAPIRMYPTAKNAAINYRVIRSFSDEPAVRLCLEGECPEGSNHGYLEVYNKTTSQWVPICDNRFTEHNARVVCRQLGLETFNEFQSFGRRWEFQPTALSRIRSWPEPFQCNGIESRLEDCDVRMSTQAYDHIYSCPWDSESFVFVHCGERSLAESQQDYWGGIRFSVASYEENLLEQRRLGLPLRPSAAQQLEMQRERQSRLYYVNITGAGILHGERSPAVLSVLRPSFIQQVNISQCASDGISLISPSHHLPLLDNRIEDNLGVGINILMLNGETRDADLSAFSPLRHAQIPYNTFGILDACDPGKQVLVEERILVYYRYDNRPADCVKIFTSVYGVKTFGFRLLQLNLVNATEDEPWEPDSITLYDGDIYNITSTLLTRITASTSGPAAENRLYRSRKHSLSLKVHSSGANGWHGFIAEVITLPIAAIGFGRDVRHNISYSSFTRNQMGAIRYASAGEINPMLTMEWNRINDNGIQLYGNFSTCEAAVLMDVQNMETLLMRNNLIRGNQGGLHVRSDSSGVPTSLKAVIHNNVFADNANRETLLLHGRRSSPYQEVTLYYNYVTRSRVPYRDVVLLDQVVANLTVNFIFNNLGYHIMDVYGFGRVRLPIYQTFYHNNFHKNFALDRDNRGTVIAGSSGQRYIDNVFVNPDNDYELIALNWTGNATWEASLEMQRTPIEAINNWWGYNETTAVVGRIRDYRDVAELLEVRFEPFVLDNRTVLSGKCDPGWSLVGDTCYLYVGVPMNFSEAKEFCKKDNASLPYLMSNYYGVTEFLQSQQIGFDYYARVWVQHLDLIGRCAIFMNRRVEQSPCDMLLPFLCEADPLVMLDPLGWTDDALTVALLGTSAAALLLVILCSAFWVSKSRHRAAERFERRNSIRNSIRSSRSFNSLASSNGFLSENGGVRRKPFVAPKGAEKLTGSVDSIEKTQLNSSVEDNRSFDIYEAHDSNSRFAYSQLDHRPPPRGPPVLGIPTGPAAVAMSAAMSSGQTLTFENHGFRDNSTYFNESQDPSRAPSEYWDSSSVGQNSQAASVSVHQNGTVSYQPQPGGRPNGREPDYTRIRSRSEAAVGLDDYSTASGLTDSTLAMKRELDDSGSDAASAVTLPHHHPAGPSQRTGMNINRPPSTTRSQQLLETNFDTVEAPPPRHAMTTSYLVAAGTEPGFNALAASNRSKSTPLETDM